MRQELRKKAMEVVVQSGIVRLYLLDSGRQRVVLPAEPPGYPPERLVDAFQRAVGAQPVLTGHLLDDQPGRERDRRLVAA